MTAGMTRERFEQLRAARGELPRVAGRRGRRADVKYGSAEAWRPAVDISERGAAYVVTVDIPGVKASDLEITMEDGLLTILGRRHAARAAGEKVHRSERVDGGFCRQLRLPSSHVQAVNSQVSARNGVLEIVVPKAPVAQSGLIRVRVR